MKSYPVRVAVELEPVGTPMVKVVCQDQHKVLRPFTQTSWVVFEFFQETGPARLSVELYDKHPHDPTTAVIIKQIKLNDIEHLQNIYQGMYYPHNMDPKRDTYIAWNGVWILDFTVPVYTWMHQTQGLGWIYD